MDKLSFLKNTVDAVVMYTEPWGYCVGAEYNGCVSQAVNEQ